MVQEVTTCCATISTNVCKKPKASNIAQMKSSAGSRKSAIMYRWNRLSTHVRQQNGWRCRFEFVLKYNDIFMQISFPSQSFPKAQMNEWMNPPDHLPIPIVQCHHRRLAQCRSKITAPSPLHPSLEMRQPHSGPSFYSSDAVWRWSILFLIIARASRSQSRWQRPISWIFLFHTSRIRNPFLTSYLSLL